MAKNGQLSNHRDDLGFFPVTGCSTTYRPARLSPVPGNSISNDAGSKIRKRIAECTYKFIGVSLAVCAALNAPNSGSPRIAFAIVGNSLKALRNFDWTSIKV